MADSKRSSMEERLKAKRQLRKGTRSCWECKRRKTRCNFRSQADQKCVACTQRGLPCQSQEHEEPISLSTYSTTDRLARLETMVEKLVYSLPGARSNGVRPEAPINQLESPASTVTGVAQNEAADPKSRQPSDWQTHEPEQFSYGHNPLDYIHDQQDDSLSTLTRISQVLHAELPCIEDMVELTSNSNGTAFLSFTDYFNVSEKHRSLERERIMGLSATSHPVLLAKALLHLAFCLQHAASNSASLRLRIKQPYTKVASRWIQIATKLVTVNDHFMESVEALQCLLIEGHTLINSGSLRRAWICFRRALSFAQIMGFHQEIPATVKCLDKGTQYSRAYMWSVIIYQERFLALLIGTPTATTGEYLNEKDMATGSPAERLSKRHGVILSHLVERTQSLSCKSLGILHSVDRDLQAASTMYPLSWWHMPLPDENKHPEDYVADVTRAHVQITHFSLIIYLHLPFLMATDAGLEYTSSKLACLAAAREVLSRFNIIRGYIKDVVCCRFAEFSAFNAGMTLLLAYMDNIQGGLHDVLEPHRPGDMALFMLTMETMEKLRLSSCDTVSREALESMKKLFDFYQCAFRHDGNISIHVLRSRHPEIDDSLEISCQLFVPYYGTICIVRHDEGCAKEHVAPSSASSSNGRLLSAGTPFSSAQTLINSTAHGLEISQPDLGSVDPNPNAQSGPVLPTDTGATAIPELDLSGVENMMQPDFFAEGTDWGLQGVDMTFFNCIIGTDSMQQGFH